MKRTPDWQVYERMVARLVADQLTTELGVTPNARIRGSISGISRQGIWGTAYSCSNNELVPSKTSKTSL
jgi:hypothetical protein